MAKESEYKDKCLYYQHFIKLLLVKQYCVDIKNKQTDQNLKCIEWYVKFNTWLKIAHSEGN